MILTTREALRSFFGMMKILTYSIEIHLDFGGGYSTQYICQNSLYYTSKMVNFTKNNYTSISLNNTKGNYDLPPPTK
jgi:hypothetical protein